MYWERERNIESLLPSGANPTTSKFATRTPTSYVGSKLQRFLKVEENIFVFKTD
jgi:hypothetical protein